MINLCILLALLKVPELQSFQELPTPANLNEESDLQFDLPLQDPRITRDAEQLVANLSTASPFVGGGGQQEWIEEAVKDVAYYLRSHKFNEFDRRYYVNKAGHKEPETKKNMDYHKWFPRPPLRNLHWEVQNYCAETFLTCLHYLWRKVRETDSRRTDDTAVVMLDQKWEVNNSQVKIVDEECKKLRAKDEKFSNPFQGPLERFQWRTTASYFMCWFVMNDVEDLRHLTENCDNFANCLEATYGPRNRDFRANDDTPFACALYSFCPDPCCQMRHSAAADRCWSSSNDNPCYHTSTAAAAANNSASSSAVANKRECILQRSQNTNFNSIVLNQWNVTCECPLEGHRWDSTYGICVDLDECTLGTHTCKDSEACLNLRGSYRCVCKWGHSWDLKTGVCVLNVAVGQIKLSILAEDRREGGGGDAAELSLIRRFCRYVRQRFMEMASSAKNDANACKKVPAVIQRLNSILLMMFFLLILR